MSKTTNIHETQRPHCNSNEERKARCPPTFQKKRSRRHLQPTTIHQDHTSLIQEFAARPCVKNALEQPWHPNSVLSFFTGIDCTDPNCYKALLNKSKLSQLMDPIIRHGGVQYHQLCRPFAPVIRAAGKRQLPASTPDCDWFSVDGIVAQIVLCSQLARSCFRGHGEAYAYSDVSVELTHRLQVMANASLKEKPQTTEDYRQLKKSFASMTILASLYSSSSPLQSSNTSLLPRQRQGSGSLTSSTKPPDSITLPSVPSISVGSTIRSISLDSLSDLDSDMDELNSIKEASEEELLFA